jgi:hypothetical protein
VLWYKKKMQAFPGNLIVKNQRIVLEQHRVNAVGGLLGALIISSSKKTKGGPIFDEKINSVSIDAADSTMKRFKTVFSSSESGAKMELMADASILEEINGITKAN